MSWLFRGANWPVDWPLYALAVTAMLYLLGGRMSAARSDAARKRRGFAFYAGIVVVALAVSSPIDAYEARLFWVHMMQHILLMMVAPPLLLLGRPWPRLLRPFPQGIRLPIARSVLAGSVLGPARRAAQFIASPLPAFVLFNGTLLMWHLPVLYDLTLRNGSVHDLEHALFFGTGLLFWVHLLPSTRPQLTDGWRVAYGTGALITSWLLAIVLGLAPNPVYSAYASLDQRPGGLSALSDQHLAAGMMWVPGAIPYAVALFFAAFRWLDPAAGRRRRMNLQPRET
ncbi:MAG TPA: cytochrome c oxidase assembly protein [Gaiellaceae bacterium]|jgi:cytochrome c oxidase assembly factor CtaG